MSRRCQTAPGLGRAAVYREVRSVACEEKWKRWTCEEAVVAYTRTELSIAERDELLNRSYTVVAGLVRDYRQRPAGPYRIKQ